MLSGNSIPIMLKIFAMFCDKPEIPPVTILNIYELSDPGVMKLVKPNANMKAERTAKSKPLV